MKYLPVFVCVEVGFWQCPPRFLWFWFFLFKALLLSIQINNLLLTPSVNLLTVNGTQ